MKIKRRLKYFLISMTATMLVLVLFTGFVVVEKNARAVILGDNSPFLEYEKNNNMLTRIKFHFMGKDYTLNF